MPRELTKEAVRRNPLAVWVSKIARWILARKGVAAGVVAGILAIAAGTGAYLWHQERQEREAQGLVARAHKALWGETQGAARDPEEAKKLYAEVAARFPRTVAAEESLIRLGNLQFDGERYDEAIATFGRYLNAYARGRFRVMAGIGKAYSEEAKGDLVAAERTLTELLKTVEDDPLEGEAYASLAHIYEVMKRPEDAIRVYGQISERFAQTHWAQNALQRMSLLRAK
jgi:outer membrane protein assembly factor BamD (BamD/ComL family)